MTSFRTASPIAASFSPIASPAWPVNERPAIYRVDGRISLTETVDASSGFLASASLGGCFSAGKTHWNGIPGDALRKQLYTVRVTIVTFYHKMFVDIFSVSYVGCLE